MTELLVVVVALVLGSIGMAFAACALVPRRGALDRLSMVHLGFGLPGSELSTLLAGGGVLMLLAALALGVGDHPLGRLALALHGLAIAGLLWALWRARGTGRVLDGVLADAFGADGALQIAPSRRALLARKFDPRRWWLPMAYRHPDVECRRGLPYADPAHRQQHLDVWVGRAPSRGPRPVLLNIHGGGWTIGSKGTQAMPLLVHMAAHGWLVVDADYRLSPGVRMPEHLIDVKRAIAWTRAHAAGFGGDPRFIAITGGSAGGHLVSLAALTANQPQWQPGFEQDDTRVQAVVSMYGKYDLLGEARPDAHFADFLARTVMPGARARHAALWQAMQPTSHLAAAAAAGAGALPPFFVLHGTHDVLIPPAEARWFVGRLRQAHVAEVVYAELPFAHHGWDVPHSPRADHTVEALQRYLELQYARWCAHHGVVPTPAAAAADAPAAAGPGVH